MNKKIIPFGAVIMGIIMVLMPSINAVNYHIKNQVIENDCTICTKIKEDMSFSEKIELFVKEYKENGLNCESCKYSDSTALCMITGVLHHLLVAITWLSLLILSPITGPIIMELDSWGDDNGCTWSKFW